MLELVLQPVVVSTHPNDMWVNSMTLSKYWQSNLWHHSGCTKRAPPFFMLVPSPLSVTIKFWNCLDKTTIHAIFTTVDGCEILHQLIAGKHPIIYRSQPSFWWCRLSQPQYQWENSQQLLGSKFHREYASPNLLHSHGTCWAPSEHPLDLFYMKPIETPWIGSERRHIPSYSYIAWYNNVIWYSILWIWYVDIYRLI